MSIAIIRPAIEINFSLTAVGGNSVQVVDSGDPVSHDDDVTYAQGELAQQGVYQVQGVPWEIGSVIDFKMAHRSHNKNEGACTEYCKVYANGQWSPASLPNTGNSWITRGPTTIARPGGGSWVPDDFKNLNDAFRIGCLVAGDAILLFPRITSLWGELHYTEPEADVDKLALVAQELQRDRNAKRGHMVTVPLAWLGREIIDDVQLVSAEGLEPTGDGFGMSELAVPRLQRIMGMKLSPTNRRVGLVMRDMHHAVMLYDQLVLPYKVSSERFGAFELYPAGASKATTRDSKVYVHQTGTRVTCRAIDVEPVTREGELIETTRTNEFKNSSLVAGVAVDWTALNTGVNGSAVEDDTVDLLFEGDISTKSCKITGGSPLGGNPVGIEQDITLPSIAPLVDDPRKISIDKKDDTGHALSIKIQRDSDNWYRTSLSADDWGAAETYLDLPVDRDATRYLDMAPIYPGVHAGIVYTVGLYAKTSAGQINHFYHAQWERHKYATSRMVSGGGATYTRTPSIVQITNQIGARTVHKPRGSLYFRVVPEWAPAERDFDADFLYVYHSATNYFRVFFDHGSGELKLHWYDGSNHYSTIDSADVAWTAYDELKFGFRWMSTGDLEATAPEFQLFADFGAGWVTGIKGALSAWKDESDASYIQIGAKGDAPITTAADAYIKYLKSIPEPLLLDYFKALP